MQTPDISSKHQGDCSARDIKQVINLRQGQQIIRIQTFLYVLIGIIDVFVDVLLLTLINHK